MRSLLFLLTALTVASAELASRVVPARDVPVPVDTVSPQVAEVIAEPIADLPTPQDAAGWKKLQAAYDAKRAADTKASAETRGCQIEETTLGGVRCFLVTPKEIAPANKDRLLVHLHGGAYVLGSGLAAAMEAVLVADACQTKVLSVDYRMPPDHPFPAALDDAVSVWKALLKDRQPAQLALFGTSAGGGLTMATVHKLKELKLPLPRRPHGRHTRERYHQDRRHVFHQRRCRQRPRSI